jgi:hypothetical protein
MNALSNRQRLRTFERWTLTLVVALFLAGETAGAQSLSYSSGQAVFPAYEGWEENPDGSLSFVFGYMNRNWAEELDVPIGPDTSFNLGGADQGQPTHFLPRRNRFVFRVPVPKGFTEKDELIWTLATRGKAERAYATLRTDYKIENVTIMSETGALGAGTSSPEVRANKPPKLEIQGQKKMTAKVGQPLPLAAVVTDDGIPKRRQPGLSGAAVSNQSTRRDAVEGRPGSENPIRANRAMLPPARVTVGKNVGLHVSWFVYRGAGKVTFNPEQIMVWEDTRAGANSPWAPVWMDSTLEGSNAFSVKRHSWSTSGATDAPIRLLGDRICMLAAMRNSSSRSS